MIVQSLLATRWITCDARRHHRAVRVRCRIRQDVRPGGLPVVGRAGGCAARSEACCVVRGEEGKPRLDAMGLLDAGRRNVLLARLPSGSKLLGRPSKANALALTALTASN